MNFLKNKKIWIAVGVIIAIGLSYGVGFSSAKTEIQGKKAGYEYIQKKISDAEYELESIQEEIDSAGVQLEEKDDDILEFLAGHYIVGSLDDELPNGRYIIKPVDGEGEFVVYEPNGEKHLDIVLSDTEGNGVSEYVAVLGGSMLVTSETPFTLQRIEH